MLFHFPFKKGKKKKIQTVFIQPYCLQYKRSLCDFVSAFLRVQLSSQWVSVTSKLPRGLKSSLVFSLNVLALGEQSNWKTLPYVFYPLNDL